MFNAKVRDERIKIAKTSKNDLLALAKESFVLPWRSSSCDRRSSKIHENRIPVET